MNFVGDRRTPGSLVYYKSRDCSIQFLQQRTFNLRLIFFLTVNLELRLQGTLEIGCVYARRSVFVETMTSAGSAVGRGMVKVNERMEREKNGYWILEMD